MSVVEDSVYIKDDYSSSNGSDSESDESTSKGEEISGTSAQVLSDSVGPDFKLNLSSIGKVFSNLFTRQESGKEKSSTMLAEEEIETKKKLRQEELLQVAPNLAFTKPIFKEEADGIDKFLQVPPIPSITRLDKDVLQNLQILQLRLIVFKVHYEEWTRLVFPLLAKEAKDILLMDLNYDVNLPWPEFLMSLTQLVSINEEKVKAHSVANNNSFIPSEWLSTFIRRRVAVIKSLPPLVDKHLALENLRKVIRRHFATLIPEDFQLTLDNYEQLAITFEKCRIQFHQRRLYQ